MATHLTVMQCRRFSSCSTCAARRGCEWRVLRHECLQAIGTASDAAMRQPSLCPRVRPLDVSRASTVLHSGEYANPRLVLLNLHAAIQRYVSCRFQCGSSNVFTSGRRAVIAGSAVNFQCPPTRLSYSELVSIRYCNVSVQWHRAARSVRGTDQGHVLDSVSVLRLELYKCGLVAQRCDACTLLLPVHYQCRWCQVGGCAKTCRALTGGLEYTREDLCPNPTISSVFPSNGTAQGNTILTVHGYNLGRRSSQVKIALQWLGHGPSSRLPCAVLSEGYEPSRTVRCQLSSTKLRPATSVYELLVTTADRYHARSASNVQEQHFHILLPRLMQFQPLSGQQRGGTLLRLDGVRLNVGRELSIVLYHLTRVPGTCLLVNRTATQVFCRTQRFYNPGQYQLQLKFDGRASPEPGMPGSWDWDRQRALFKVFPDAVVLQVRDVLVTESGGNLVEVHGRYLRGVQVAKLRVHINSATISRDQLRKTQPGELTNMTVSGVSVIVLSS